jgi:hypothetical protein
MPSPLPPETTPEWTAQDEQWTPATNEQGARLIDLIDELSACVRDGKSMGLGDVSIANGIRAKFLDALLTEWCDGVKTEPLREDQIQRLESRRLAAREILRLRSENERLTQERNEARDFASRWMTAAMFATPVTTQAFDPMNPEAFAESRRHIVDQLAAKAEVVDSLRSELEARDAEIARLGRQHYAALSKLDDENSRLRFELSRSRSESAASVPNTGTALSEEERATIDKARIWLGGDFRGHVPRLDELLAIIDRLSSAPSPALSEDERSFMTRDWCIAMARTEEASELCALITRGKSALENWGRHHPWCAHASSPFAPCNCGLALEIAALAAPSRGSDSDEEQAR